MQRLQFLKEIKRNNSSSHKPLYYSFKYGLHNMYYSPSEPTPPSEPPLSPSAPPCPQMDSSTGYDKDLQKPRPWSTGLCDCCQDFHTCCLTCWCPCVTFGRIAEIVDRGSTSCGTSGAIYTLIMAVTGCGCLYSCFYRTKLRGQYSLNESPCTDCCVHCCCERCALCQEYRELHNHGFHMSIGWHGNIERQRRLAGTPPSVEPGMSRF